MKKSVVLLIFVFSVVFISAFSFPWSSPKLSPSDCSTDQVIMKFSAASNAHGFAYEKVANQELNYYNVFGKCYETSGNPHQESGYVVSLSSREEGHGAFNPSNQGNYPIIITYGDLQCSPKDSCGLGEKLLFSMSSMENAHFALGNYYPIKICCVSGNEEIECGDGVVGSGEECDDGNSQNGDGCSDVCEIEYVCGNDVVERSNEEGMWEQCDGEAMDGFSCENLEAQGIIPQCEICDDDSISCNDDCLAELDFGEEVCGDGDLGNCEICETIDESFESHKVLTCEDFGFTNCDVELIRCDPDSCTPYLGVCSSCGAGDYCGNEVIDIFNGEQCDGSNLDDWSCEDFGFRYGVLRCSDSCGFDLSGCSQSPPETGGECNTNDVCDDGEGCNCADCHGFQSSCALGQVCNYATDSCGSCPTGTVFDSTSKICKPKTFSIEIIKPSSVADIFDKIFVVGDDVDFEQNSENSMKDLTIRWDFGDGENEENENCLTSGDCDTVHAFENFGIYTAQATAREQGGRDSKRDYTQFIVYDEGINVFAVISSPEAGSEIPSGEPAEFNASKSFVAECFDSEEDCDAESSDCYVVTGSEKTLYCYDLSKLSSVIGKDYDLLFEWTFTKVKESEDDADVVIEISGTWSEDYGEVVDFSRYFFAEGTYTADLDLTYGGSDGASSDDTSSDDSSCWDSLDSFSNPNTNCCGSKIVTPSIDWSTGKLNGYGCCSSGGCHSWVNEGGGCETPGSLGSVVYTNELLNSDSEEDYYVVCYEGKWFNLNCDFIEDCSNFNDDWMVLDIESMIDEYGEESVLESEVEEYSGEGGLV